VKKTIAALACVLLVAGCGKSGEPETSYSPDADEQAMADIVWDPGDGGEPKLEFQTPLSVLSATIGVVAQGDGEAIALGDEVIFDMVVFSGADGTVVDSTYTTHVPERVVLSVDTTDTVLLQALTQLKVGARLMYATPGTINTEEMEADPSAAPSISPTSILAITVTSARKLADHASGAPIEPAAGLPKVSDGEDGALAITIPAGDPPAELVSQDLIEGTGDAVQSGQTVACRYTGWLWDGGAEFDSTWTAEAPAAFSLDGVIEGWRAATVGHRVGSRVLAVIPPGLAYGGAGSDVVPPGATLVFVTDILAAY
jgi:peptidylprolyl isomerase